jgi:hypothetical protein
MVVETLGDIVRELADKLGIYENRNAWEIEIKSRIIAAIEIERAVYKNYGSSIDAIREAGLEKADLESRRLDKREETNSG